jgi:hypothetical protein
MLVAAGRTGGGPDGTDYPRNEQVVGNGYLAEASRSQGTFRAHRAASCPVTMRTTEIAAAGHGR